MLGSILCGPPLTLQHTCAFRQEEDAPHITYSGTSPTAYSYVQWRADLVAHGALVCAPSRYPLERFTPAAADDAADAEAEDAAKGAIPGASPNTKARRQAAHTTAVCAGTAGLKQVRRAGGGDV
eukprot:1160179-Pelagomonas_calceolata.AAC.11